MKHSREGSKGRMESPEAHWDRARPCSCAQGGDGTGCQGNGFSKRNSEGNEDTEVERRVARELAEPERHVAQLQARDLVLHSRL